MINLYTDIQYIKGVGPGRARLFNKLGIYTVEELLYFIPFRYEDRRNIRPINTILKNIWRQRDEQQTVQGRILSSNILITPKQGKKIFEVSVEDGSGHIMARWFNQTYLKEVLKRGKTIVLSGNLRVDTYTGKPYLEGPEFEIIDSSDGELIHTGRIVPIYHLTEGLSQKIIRKIIKSILDTVTVDEILPERLIRRYRLPSRYETLKNIHFPPEDASVEGYNLGNTEAHKRLIFEELLLLEVGLAMRKAIVAKEPGISFNPGSPLVERLQSLLPFRLTSSQQKVIDEIRKDMACPHPMNRLLQGDVGCGKTIVALTAMLIAVDNGFQAALMAPTEILAEQHSRNIKTYLDTMNIKSAVVTGKLKLKERGKILLDIACGDIDIIIGTHALIEEGVEFRHLGLVVIDEQHKFGVLQRSSLKKKGYNPDVLVMTATPIPRTLAMSIYGDLDLSIIDELPEGRLPVETKWLYGKMRKEAYYIMKDELEKGRQVYVIYPLVEESEKVDLRAATKMAKRLQKAFPGYTTGLLHGRMKSQEKEKIMQLFKDNKIHILVSTTVVEVGVDVSNATVMIIEHAERFGLSQLHQLRGRVGRGNRKSICLLLTDGNITQTAVQRLRALEETTNGFEIAEKDLSIRGPGELFGIRQSGLPELRISNLVRDAKILEVARREAFEIINEDPGLKKAEHQCLKNTVERKWRDKLELATVS